MRCYKSQYRHKNLTCILFYARLLSVMSNFIEAEARIIEEQNRIAVQKEMQVWYTGIFYTSKVLLENKGQLVKKFRLISHRVFEDVAPLRGQEVRVTISSGADLEKANKMSIYIQGMGLLEVRKKGVLGEETFNGIFFPGVYFPGDSGVGAELQGNHFEIPIFCRYSETLDKLYYKYN